MDKNIIVHPFPPLFDKNSETLILGSFPSVKSREEMFFYGHPQNRFWKVLSAIFNENVPETIEDKKTFVLSHTLPYGIQFIPVRLQVRQTAQ